MKLITRLALLCSISFVSAACVGPLTVNETARTVGRHNSELVFGGGQAGVALKYSFGLSESVDLGLQLESTSLGLRLKYAFVDNQTGGWSSALAAGIGTSVGGSHYYGDFLMSYLFGTLEPFGVFRYVHVDTNPQDFKDKDTGAVTFHIPSGHFEYGEVMAGTRLWMSKNWLFTIEAGTFVAFSSGLKVTNGAIVDGAFGYRF